MEQLKHECGVAMIRLLKPLEYYEEKYGTWMYGLNKLYLLMEKQHNRGQEGSSAEGSELQEDALKVFDLSGLLHAQLAGLSGETFLELDLVESDTNHNHEDIVESIEVYQCVAIKRLQ